MLKARDGTIRYNTLGTAIIQALVRGKEEKKKKESS